MNRVLLRTLVIVVVLFFGQSVPASTGINLTVKNPPISFTQYGKTVLVYELFITPPCCDKTNIAKIEVLRDGPKGEVLLKYEGDELARFHRIADNYIRDDVIFLWITLDKKQRLPKQLYHRITIAKTNEKVEGALTKVSKELAPIISAPLRGEGWIAVNGPSNLDGHHRISILAINNQPFIGQRFATDFMKIGDDGKIFKNKGRHNKDYPSYGQELLAVADGIIVDTKDGIPENEPVTKRAIDVTMGTAGGNYVVLKIGKDKYAFYAHLIPGSLSVKIGDKVKQGDVLGLLGNSGNSDAPHLHFHICKGMDFLFSEGIPYELASFDMLGHDENWITLFTKRAKWESSQSVKKIHKELMGNGDVISF